ncbi:xanthine dehydrogenase molybdopterin binding subunit [Aliiroseovarius lamellibrachiae]|uniref:xanthine dehydrogenase molybdopterin binding subunit n=1 Tax=Aliiroseovarius lamellibrachiae TaxID=1924933 RepID=UPI001BE0F1FC|nr:xanthine dehydrogenase molybdopterin binding subunit [Aliiroseovarius lamellibrachiae]MBT2129686.1 xanthine dehydrogenase molybdopterin binding subunit [Aliiroseovarius lamellibrachiae]
MSIGKPLPHDTAHLHVTGAARYVDDIPTPTGTLHLAFGLSDVAHGEITAMDLSAVRNAPGVITVLTAEDVPFENDVSPAAHDEPLLSTGSVHYVGQPIFLVVATSHLAARKAARLGKIDIAEKPAVLTIDQAMEADSRFEGGPVIWSRGKAKDALTSAPHLIEGQFEMGGQEHFYLEGQAAMALPGEDGEMLVHSSTQHPSEIQHKVAHAIGLPMHAVRVETRRMGGGFGGKESQGNALAVACAIAARQTGKPCKMRYDRDDDMVITGKRHDFRIAYRAGVDAAGKLLGLEVTQFARCGWAQDLSLPVADRAMLHADNAYFLENVEITSHRLKTNTQSATAYRGFGGPQGVLGIERILEHIARDRGLDPIEVRRVNFYADGQTTHYGQEIEGFHIPDMCDALLTRAEFSKRRAEVDAFNAENPVLKRGLGFSPVKFGISFTLTHLNQAGALVHVYQDGSIHLNHGGTEMGQGLFQKVAQVAASVFAVDMNVVKITATDTAKVPNTSATAASSGSDLNGMAVKAACETIRERISTHLAESWRVAPGDVVFSGGQVQAAGHPPISFAEAAGQAYFARISLSSTGFYKTPKITWDRIKGRGRPFLYFAHGVALCEVVIDTLTGENRILRTDIIHDTGNSLNPALDVGQVEGAFVQGAGWLTTEELVWDDAGRLRTHAPSTYKIPASSDRPRIFNVDLWNKPNSEDTVGRSKAVGEPPFMLGISAWLALADAISACGDGFHDLNAPATSEEVLASVDRVRSA